MEESYAQRYRQLYHHHWWWRARERFLVQHLERLSPPGGFGAILDVGCGDGLFFPLLARFGEPEGVEPDPLTRDPAASPAGPIHPVPFDATFDTGRRYGLVLMLDVVEHLDDDGAALRRARELLAPGGRLVVTVPALPFLWTGHDELNHHRRRYTRRSLRRLAERAGVRPLELAYFFHWLVLVKLLVVVKERLTGSDRRPPEVPAESWNHLLLGLSLLEQRSWGRLPWPWGSSLLLIGAA
jgi:SAM-dependent methyltransferase